MKEKLIENINQTTGVTPQQLFDYCHHLIKKISIAKGLPTHQQNEAINDTVINVYNQMQLGNVNKFDCTLFKGYLFIALKTTIERKYQDKGLNKNNITNNIKNLQIDYTDDEEDDFQFQLGFDDNSFFDKEEKQEQQKKINSILKLLNKKQQAFMKEILAGEKGYVATKKYGIKYSYIIDKIKKQLNKKGK